MSQWNHSRRNHNAQRTGGAQRRSVGDALLKLVDLGLAAVVFVGPHLLGGRHLLGRFAILALCVATAVAWFARQCLVDKPRWIGHYSFGMILLALAGVSFQIVPLPQSWLAALAPQHAEMLPLWNDGGTSPSLGLWQTLSLSPEDTRLALATLVAYALLFITTVQRIESFHDVKRFTGWIAASAVLVAAFGVVQYFTGNGKFFWLYDHPYVDTTVGLKAAFTNKNHFAHFLSLGLANLLAWIMLSRTERPRRQTTARSWGSEQHESSVGGTGYSNLVMGAALTLVVFAVLASLSRGGILAAVGATAVFGIVCARERLLKAGHFFVGAALMLLIVGALSLSGSYEMVAKRMESLTTSVDDMDSGGARRAIWAANVEACRTSPWTGWGVGAHRFVYPLFIAEPAANEFTHAENGYLQIASEAGLPGLVLLAGAIAVCGSCCVRTLRSATANQPMRITGGGIAAALTASLVHSTVDFVWFIPACMTATVLLAACALRLSQLATPADQQTQVGGTPRPLTRFNIALAVSLAGGWAVMTMLPAAQTSLKWDAYVRADQAVQSSLASKAWASAGRLEELAQAESLNRDALLRSLVEVVRLWPNSARAHARLAGALLSRFEQATQASENPMTISQIREAAEASHFDSPTDLRAWLLRAFGDDSRLLYLAYQQAHEALRLCPLEGEGYLYLAELAFLENYGPAAFTAFTQQGLKVRPHDASLLFTVGKNYYVNGDLDRALEMWARAYQITCVQQSHIIGILAGRMAAASFLQTFAPDWRTLETLWARYRQVGTVDDLQTILPYAVAQAQQETRDMYHLRAGRVWLGLAQMQLEMNSPQDALTSLQLSYAATPESVATRRQLGKCLLHFQQYEAAESHLRWCSQKYPDNPTYRAELLQATRAKMQHIARTTRTTAR